MQKGKARWDLRFLPVLSTWLQWTYSQALLWPSSVIESCLFLFFPSFWRGDQYGWLPASYLFCNLAVLALGVWAIASASNEDASQLFLLGMLFTIIHDIIIIAICYTSDNPASHYRFCVGMAILSLILKPLSCLLIFQNHRNRGGGEGYSWAGSNYVTIEGQSSSQPAPGHPWEIKYQYNWCF